MNIIQDYEEASGQKINLHKLDDSFSWTVPITKVNELEMLMGIKVVKEHSK